MNARKNTDVLSPLIRLRGLDRLPRGIICDRGFKLMGTPLGFTGARNSGLLFYANMDDPLPGGTQRVIGTSISVDSLRRVRPSLNALAVDFGQVVRLGRMDLRMLSAGMGFGSAMLEIKFNQRKILFCGGVRMSDPLGSTPAEVSPCDLLLIDTPVADSRPPSPATGRRKLRAWLKKQGTGRGFASAIVCDSHGAALDVVRIAGEMNFPVHAHRPIFERLQGLNAELLNNQPLKRLNQEWPQQGLVLYTKQRWPRARWFNDIHIPTAFAGPGKACPHWATENFRFGEREDRSGLIAFARQCQASQIALGPQCDRATAKAMEAAGLKVHYLETPVQLPLLV